MWRETQAKSSLVCEGVECLLNASHGTLTVDVLLPEAADEAALARAGGLASRVEAAVARAALGKP